ncbi:MAG TPA: hypothetical protein VIM87_20010 [Chitinophaga sp.]|uniref:hypothetical protein n=1 Tax=Chitinophaga sp. TaxID=1869181 RepID=UPI002F9215A2
MSDVSPKSPPTDGAQQDAGWQLKLLPWMILLPTVLIGVFIVQATLRMKKFEAFVYQQERSIFEKNLPSPADTASGITNDFHYQQLYVLARMEEYTINKRYNQAGIITMSTIYTKYLGFFTGMILAIVGSVFIIGKLKEDQTQTEGSLKDVLTFKVVSSSPGVIFAVLGTVLMSVSIISKGEVNVNDLPLYLNGANFINAQDSTARKIDSSKINKLPFTIPEGEARSSHP